MTKYGSYRFKEVGMSEARNKIMTAKEAVGKYVCDGCSLILGNYTVAAAMALIYEIVRQQKKNMTVYSQSGVIDVEVLVEGGCVDRLVSTYVYRGGGRSGGSSVERALQAGTLQMEDYTNFQYNARLVAGMHGFTFSPVLEGAMDTDLFRIRTFMGEDKYRVINCPYTGKEILTVPAANPDVCIVHVQRADKFGNAQYWGALGSVAAAALSSKRIIVSCEEIVEHDIIQSSPHLTVIPAYRVDAVVEIPWGANPSDVIGYYNLDWFMFSLFAMSCGNANAMKAWMDEWVYGCKDREAYIDHYAQKYGSGTLDSIRAKAFYSAPANYGTAFTSSWDEEGRARNLGVTMEEFEKFLKEKEALYE